MTRHLLVGILGGLVLCSGDAAAAPCSESKMNQIRASGAGEVEVDCDVELEPHEEIDRLLVFLGPEASGTRVDCGRRPGVPGALLKAGVHIMSRFVGPEGTETNLANWARPEDIRIEHCRLGGAVRIRSMSNGGNDVHARPSSRMPGHTARARAAAPTDIVLRDLVIETSGSIPLYLSQGVTHVQLLDSELKGSSGAVAIYLDAETGHNTLRNNYIHPVTARELIAIDGSSDNLIVNNRFSSLNHGGIYLYRNCGERGTVRHNTPSRNQLINNSFYYNKYLGGTPAVFIASRDGTRPDCDADDAWNLGSGASDLDYARDNVLMQNQIFKFQFEPSVWTNRPELNSPNYVAHNETVTARISRRAGCWVPTAFARDFILDGQSIEAVVTRDGAPRCVVQRCDDGILSNSGNCSMTTSTFQCRVEGDNEGCSTTARCPAGSTEIIGATAACNLEFGEVSSAQLAGVSPGQVAVLRESGNAAHGTCRVGSTTVQRRRSPARGGSGRLTTQASCREHDANGGDCHVRGTLYCRTEPAPTTTPTIVLPPGTKLPTLGPGVKLPGPVLPLPSTSSPKSKPKTTPPVKP
jgi:hypothetical protein